MSLVSDEYREWMRLEILLNELKDAYLSMGYNGKWSADKHGPSYTPFDGGFRCNPDFTHQENMRAICRILNALNGYSHAR